jgi:hypothetical protein
MPRAQLCKVGERCDISPTGEKANCKGITGFKTPEGWCMAAEMGERCKMTDGTFGIWSLAGTCVKRYTPCAVLASETRPARQGIWRSTGACFPGAPGTGGSG